MSLSISRDAALIIADLTENFDATEIRRELTSHIRHCEGIIADGEKSTKKFPGAAESLEQYRAALAALR